MATAARTLVTSLAGSLRRPLASYAHANPVVMPRPAPAEPGPVEASESDSYHIQDQDIDPPHSSESLQESCRAKVQDVMEMRARHGSKLGQDCWVGSEASVFDAISKMASLNTGALLVMDLDVMDRNSDGVISEEERLHSAPAIRGVVSERDYVQKVVLHGRRSDSTNITEIMTPHVPDPDHKHKICMISPDNTTLECMDAMIQQGVRHMPVVEGEKMLGIVGISDVVEWVVREQRAEVQDLRDFISGGCDYSGSNGGTATANPPP